MHTADNVQINLFIPLYVCVHSGIVQIPFVGTHTKIVKFLNVPLTGGGSDRLPSHKNTNFTEKEAE